MGALQLIVGIAPELARLNDTNFDNGLPARVADSRDTDGLGDVAEVESLVFENDVTNEDIG